MGHEDGSAIFWFNGLALLAAAVFTVPLFKRIGLGIVVGYLAAGIVLGPWGLGLFYRSERILSLAELGVVLLLFIVGLELKLSRLWTLRRDIFGLGATQVILCGLALTGAATLAGFDWRASLVAGFALALSSTAFAVQLMQERGQLRSRYGQKTFSVLLFQDVAIVPLLAAIPLIAPIPESGPEISFEEQVLRVAGALAGVLIAGRYLLDLFFNLLARIGAREVMTPAALLVVLGAGALMNFAGLSMALGAFLAGVMLAESSYRHQLEADLEPFRVLLLGLFFMGVGMSLDFGVISDALLFVALGVVAVLSIKGVLLWSLSRLFGENNADALRVAVTIPQGGEFGFVLFAAAVTAGILTQVQSNALTAIIILTMAATPLLRVGLDYFAQRAERRGVPPDRLQPFSRSAPPVVIIGFGRFGQIVAQMLMADGIEIVAIDHDPERIDEAKRYEYAVYYGDATRVDILRAAGASEATVIALCINEGDSMIKAVDAIRSEFPDVAIFCRANDRRHAIQLMKRGVDFTIRDTVESSIAFGKATLEHLGLSADRIEAIEDDVRARDMERLRRQMDGGEMAGAEILHKKTPPGKKRARGSTKKKKSTARKSKRTARKSKRRTVKGDTPR